MSEHSCARVVATVATTTMTTENCDKNASSSYCYECQAFLCADCTTSIHSQRIAQKHNVVGAATKKQMARVRIYCGRVCVCVAECGWGGRVKGRGKVVRGDTAIRCGAGADWWVAVVVVCEHVTRPAACTTARNWRCTVSSARKWCALTACWSVPIETTSVWH